MHSFSTKISAMFLFGILLLAIAVGPTKLLAQEEESAPDSTVVEASGRVALDIAASPARWSPEDPRLYRIKISIDDEIIEDQVGFRTIAVADGEILLNGQPIYLRGISIHDETLDGGGRSNSIADAETTLGLAKELGCNFVRLSHYPHPAALARESRCSGRRFETVSRQEGRQCLADRRPGIWRSEGIQVLAPDSQAQRHHQRCRTEARHVHRSAEVARSVVAVRRAATCHETHVHPATPFGGAGSLQPL